MNSYLHQFLIRFNFKKYRWNYWATSRLSLSLSVCVRPKLVFRVDMEWSVLTDGYHYHRPMGLLAFGPISGQFDALSMYWWLPQRWSPRSWIGNPHRPCSRDGDKKMRGARGRGTETSQDFVRGFSPRFTGYPISNEGKKKTVSGEVYRRRTSTDTRHTNIFFFNGKDNKRCAKLGEKK